MTNTDTLTIDGKEIKITRPEQLLWPEDGITKAQYIGYLVAVAPFLLPYTENRMLMIWRYPGGVKGSRIEERSLHEPAPEWLPRTVYGGKERILLNNIAGLVWTANLNALELHVPFDRYNRKDYPTELVFDLDPAEGMPFDLVLEVAWKLRGVLDSLSLQSFPKTSGATGLQIFVPIAPQYTFEQTRQINRFIADYMHQLMPERITLERVVERRGNKLYFDYLQLWRGRTMAAAYSVRARTGAPVSAPVTWEEVSRGFLPSDFALANMPGRIQAAGDLWRPVSSGRERLEQNLDSVLAFIETHT